MDDIELCAQMTLMKALVEQMYLAAYQGQPAEFSKFMDSLIARFQFDLRAPAHATPADADWLQSLQTQTLKDAEAFRERVRAALDRAA